MDREMGNEGAVLSGMKEAPEKFSDTIRMCSSQCCMGGIGEELTDSRDVECH